MAAGGAYTLVTTEEAVKDLSVEIHYSADVWYPAKVARSRPARATGDASVDVDVKVHYTGWNRGKVESI